MNSTVTVEADVLAGRLLARLEEAGASPDSAEAATRAMMHASRLGVDSHGARLAAHYCAVLRTGRLNPRPAVTVRRTAAASALVDGDNALGHLVAYRSMETAVSIARESGIGAVGAVRSSHFGAAGAYALAAAEAGMIGLATSNADSVVALFRSARAFHGTNPLAVAAPVPDGRPWLLDMATSSIPFNRVLLYRALGRALPAGVAADADGAETASAEAAAMLMPLGGTDFGFKGAALAGVATILSAVLLGTALDHAMLPMGGPDLATPRDLGHFVLAIDPARFGGREVVARGMRAYLDALRAAPPAPGGEPVMAPGDREWRVEAERMANGVPIDIETAAFLGLA